MTLLELVAQHPGFALLALVVLGWSAGRVVEKAVEPFKARKRPADCPRCFGTGRDPKWKEPGT